MGYLLIALIGVALLGFFIRLFYLSFIKRYNGIIPEIEKVDIMEGGAIVNQQRSGRELNRRAVVEVPNRDLSYEEQLEAQEIYFSKNPKVETKGFWDAIKKGRIRRPKPYPIEEDD